MDYAQENKATRLNLNKFYFVLVVVVSYYLYIINYSESPRG